MIWRSSPRLEFHAINPERFACYRQEMRGGRCWIRLYRPVNFRLRQGVLFRADHRLTGRLISGPEVFLEEMSCHGVLFALPIAERPVCGQIWTAELRDHWTIGCFLVPLAPSQV